MINHSRIKVLFLCTGNSCRSQMAEGWARVLKSEVIEPYSAGIEAHGMNQYAVRAMAEVGVDISSQYSKTTSDLQNVVFDYVITLCSHADSNCPVFPASTPVIHAGFDDPYTLAKSSRTDVEALGHYRRVRDELKEFIQTLPESLL